jgi:coenzyme F420-reducing hydrogenase delta subunit
MIPRSDGREGLVARVDPGVCVSCGICAGSCAPMGVGPPGRTGRDQMADARAFMERQRPGPSDVVVIACTRGGGGIGTRDGWEAAPVLGLGCAGSLHTSVVEYVLRAGAGGVMVLSCPVEDCWNREGAFWLEQRLYHDREAELRERVDRRRVRLVTASRGESGEARQALLEFREAVAALGAVPDDDAADLLRLCDEALARTGDVA